MTFAQGKVAFQQQCGVAGRSAVVDLLDEYWFFRNTLLVTRTITQKPPSDADAIRRSCVDIQTDDFSSEADLFSNSQRACGRHRPLLRLPSQLIKVLEPEPELDDEGSALSTSLNSPYPKLRHSMSSFDCQSTPSSSSSSSSKNTSHNLSFSSGGERSAKTERYRAFLRYIARETYYRKTFTEKKWRSLSDLEYMEVQGLRDLGFVFDVKEELGLINGRQKSSREPYVSEPMFTCFDTKSTQDMKDQLRFWAQSCGFQHKTRILIT